MVCTQRALRCPVAVRHRRRRVKKGALQNKASALCEPPARGRSSTATHLYLSESDAAANPATQQHMNSPTAHARHNQLSDLLRLCNGVVHASDGVYDKRLPCTDSAVALLVLRMYARPSSYFTQSIILTPFLHFATQLHHGRLSQHGAMDRACERPALPCFTSVCQCRHTPRTEYGMGTLLLLRLPLLLLES